MLALLVSNNLIIRSAISWSPDEQVTGSDSRCFDALLPTQSRVGSQFSRSEISSNLIILLSQFRNGDLNLSGQRVWLHACFLTCLAEAERSCNFLTTTTLRFPTAFVN